MNRVVRQALLTALLFVGGFLLLHGAASAKVACTLTSVTNNTASSEVVEAYNVFKTVNGANTYNFTFNVSCSGTGNTTFVVSFLGSSQSSYVEPILAGPSSSQLIFELCVPGTGACSDTSGTVWTASTNHTFSVSCPNQASCTTAFSNISGSVYSPPNQNVYVGAPGSYTTTIYFTMQ